MLTLSRTSFFIFTYTLFTSSFAFAQQTVGLFQNDPRSFEGYTLFSPLFHNTSYLIDNQGFLIQSWQHQGNAGAATYLLPNGNLLHAQAAANPYFTFGGQGGIMRELDWEGNLVWEFFYSDSLRALHHDMAVLPNGNILMIAWEFKTVEEAIANGRDPSLLQEAGFWPEEIIEVQPTRPVGGEIVWEWNAWDHLIQDFDSTKANYGVVEDHPERIDINFAEAPNGDWLHFNAINYNAELDQIVLSAPGFNELWVIDHSTTTEEAAGRTGGRYGKGGDLLFRWGNPATYKYFSAEGRQLGFQHDTQWIEPGLPGAGNFILFNNQVSRDGQNFSNILEIAPEMDGEGVYAVDDMGRFEFGEIVWKYEEPETFWSDFASGVQRLPNGNTLIAEAQTGRIFEVTSDQEIVWEYVNPVTNDGPLGRNEPIPPFFDTAPWRLSNAIFRAYRYGPDYAGLQGKDLTPQGPIEMLAVSNEEAPQNTNRFHLSQNFPNPATGSTTISFTLNSPHHVSLIVYNMLGQEVQTLTNRFYAPGVHTVRIDTHDLSAGMYFYRLESEQTRLTRTMTVIR